MGDEMMKRFKFLSTLAAVVGSVLIMGVCSVAFAQAPTAADLAALAAKVPTTDFLTVQPKILVGPAGHFDYMTIDTKNQRVFASHPGNKALTVVDIAKGTASDMDLGTEVNGVAIDSVDN
jgi:hypothetical protein